MKPLITPAMIAAQMGAASGLVVDQAAGKSLIFMQADNGVYHAPDGNSIVYLESEGDGLGNWHIFNSAGHDGGKRATLEEFSNEFNFEFIQNPTVKIVVPLGYHPDFPKVEDDGAGDTTYALRA